MNNAIEELGKKDFPPLLSEIPDPPKKLFLRGALPRAGNKLLCVVGSRKYSPYGKEVCETLIEGLTGYPIAIVSGLALGIDSIAHRSALSAGLQTIAVPGSGLDDSVLYPRSHHNLAKEIVQAGGGLLSEFEPEFSATPWSFPQRNRLMAGMSDATLVIEAEIKSGTLITSKLATEYNRDVLTVPGSIFSKSSEGPHMLLRLGATPVTSSEDILDAFGLKPEAREESDYSDCSPEELAVINLLSSPIPRDELIRACKLSPSEANTALSILELKGIIKEQMGEIYLV